MTETKCEMKNSPSRRKRLSGARIRWTPAATLNLALLCTAATAGGPIRIWSAAVVVDEQILLGDVADLRHLEFEERTKLAAIEVAEAPPPGGSRILPLDVVRDALAAAGANMAEITLSGATECAVTRPVESQPQASKTLDRASNSAVEKSGRAVNADTLAVAHRQRRSAAVHDDANGVSGAGAGENTNSEQDAADASGTLRQAVIDYFNDELARYGGTAEIAFDKASAQVLDLSSPTYEFRIRRRGGPQLGLVTVEVDVIAEGRSLQTVPLVLRLELRRAVVVARRTINQGATVGSADVEKISLTFNRLDDLGIDDAALAVGQRAKRVVLAGAMIEPGVLEQVPLVLRGQLVTVTSVSGSIRVVTAAKATQEGRYGDVIKVRSTDETQAEIDGIVTGPGEVRIGPKVLQRGREARLASGGGS